MSGSREWLGTPSVLQRRKAVVSWLVFKEKQHECAPRSPSCQQQSDLRDLPPALAGGYDISLSLPRPASCVSSRIGTRRCTAGRPAELEGAGGVAARPAPRVRRAPVA